MSTNRTEGDAVWVFLVERDLREGGDLSLHATEHDALDAAGAYVRDRWESADPLPLDPADALRAYEEAVPDERVIVGAWTVQPAR